MLRSRALELGTKKIREDPQPQPLSLLSLMLPAPPYPPQDPLRTRLQHHPRVDLVASVLVELEDVPLLIRTALGSFSLFWEQRAIGRSPSIPYGTLLVQPLTEIPVTRYMTVHDR